MCIRDSSKGLIMSCPFEERLEGQHTNKKGVPLFFVPFSEYLKEFNLIGELFSDDGGDGGYV